MKLPSPEQLAALDPNDHITKDIRSDLQRMARASLYFFARYIFGCTGLNERAHLPLCNFAQSIVTTPNAFGAAEDPRATGKSHAITIPVPAWCLVQDPKEATSRGWLPLGPNANIMVTSYKTPIATIFVESTRKRMESNPYFLWLFGDLVPTVTSRRPDNWSKEQFTVNRDGGTGPSVMAMGTECGSTSLHPHVLIIDDLVNEKNYKSDSEVASQVDWVEHSKNLTNVVRGSRIVVENSWSERDVNAAMRSKNVSAPHTIRFFSRARIVCDTCENGRPLDQFGNPKPCGERFNHPEPPRPILDHHLADPFGPYEMSDVEELYSELTSQIVSAQHENNPLAKADLTWREEWLRYYTIETPPQGGNTREAVMAIGKGPLLDFVGNQGGHISEDRITRTPINAMFVTVGLDPGLNHPGIATTGFARVPMVGDVLFVLSCSTKKLSPRDQFFLIFDELLKWGARRLTFENVALQGYIRQTIPTMAESYELERGLTLPYWVKNPNPDSRRIVGVQVSKREGDKRTRTDDTLSPYAEQRLIATRRDLHPFNSEYAIFPKGRNIDGLEAVCMTIKARDAKRPATPAQRAAVREGAIRQSDAYKQAHQGAIGYGQSV